jgi:peptidyl-prolyl cis-trans isomerase B (cyclophilin B)
MKTQIFAVISLTILLLTACQKQSQQIPDKRQHFVIHTTMGDIKGLLYDETPLHRDNFIKLIKTGYLNGSPFHRVIKSFVAQGGSNANGEEDPGYTIAAEFNRKCYHKRGALGAARESDDINPTKASSGSQFYIVVGRTILPQDIAYHERRQKILYPEYQRNSYLLHNGLPHLDGNYTIFGEIIDGMTVVDAISKVETDETDKPKKELKMTVELINK